MSKFANRYAKSYETKDYAGGGGKSAFDWQKTGRDTKTLFFKPKPDKNAIDIVPYVIKSKNHPLVKAGDAKIEEEHYVLDIHIHKNVGVNKTDVICPKKNYGKPCPICEQADDYKNKGMQKEFEALKASRRVFYNVVDVREPEKGVQIFDASHYNFEKELIDEAKAAAVPPDNFVDFADPSEKGFTVTFRAVEETFGKNKYFEFKSFSFRARQKPVAKEFQDAAISFDDLIKVQTYEEIEAVLYGAEAGAEDEGAETPSHETHEQPAVEDTPTHSVSTFKCAHPGGVFGRDNDEYAECAAGCQVWTECINEEKRLKGK